MKNFWDKVAIIPFHECWEWTAFKNKDGYGYFKFQKKTERAHRISWKLINGFIPKGLLVCHKCDNPGCVNPDHLFLGTNKDNKLDCVSKGRHFKDGKPPILFGEKHGNHVLTAKKVLKIRKEYTGKYGEMTMFAKRYGVHRSAIYRVVKRINWKHI